ncbi:MAG: hypothetical protein IV100_33570, partial [Myxococcales bacterium]|nr:hypothetical protein [Myxococcales bacterium]
AALSGGKLTVDGKTLTLSGNATLEDGTVTCAAFASEGGQRLSIGGVDLLAGAAYSAPSATCPVTTNGAMALALSDGAARFGDHDLVLSGTGVLEGGQLASASLTQPTKLALPGLLSGFGVSASYSLATKSLSVSLTGATLQVAGVTVTIAGSAAITNAQVGCITFSGDVAAPIGGAMMTVGARFAPAGFACEWLDSPVESSTFEVTLAGSATLGGVTAGFSGAGTLRDGRLACAELSAATAVSLSLADASFKAGLRYADGECTWADGTTTDAATPTLLASLSDGQLTIGGATLTLAGTGTLDDGRLACVELRATGSAPLAVAGLDFRAGARFAAQGATCGWSDAPAAEDTLELTLHEGRLRVAGAELLLSGTAVAETGLVRCAAFTVDGGTDLAFGGIAFTGGARFIARGATCDGVSAAEDRLELTLQDGKVDIGGQSVTLSGTGQVVTGGVACIAFTAAGAAPSLYGFTFEIGGFYAAAGATCAGETVSEDTFALTLATAAGPFAMDGLGRVEGGTMACAELDASGDLTELAGVAFDVGARYTAAGRACTWRDGTITAPATDPRFVATLRNGALTIGGQSLALSGEGEFAGGTIACARLDGVGAAAIELGDVSFTAGARYAAAGQTCGWSDGTAARFELSLEDGQIAVAGNTVSLSGRAELAGNAVTCATFTSAATLELGGIAFGVGARYAAAGEACGWSDGTADRFELALNDGKLTALGSTFTLSGRARVGGTRVECAELQSTGTLNLGGTTFAVGARYVAAGATCAWADGTDTSAANDTFDVTLRGGSVDIAGVVIALNGTATLRGGALACAAFEAGGSATVALGGINLGLGGARFAAAGETCTWPDGSTTTADVDTFRIALEGGELRVGNTELSLSGSAELAGGKVTCADLTAGGGTQIDVAGVRFSAGARYAAAGSECGWSDGTANVLQLTLKDGAAQVGDVALTLSGAGEIQDAQLTCADFDVTAGAALAFGGVTFDAGARFAAAGHTCGWSDGSSTRLEVTMNDGAIDVGGDTLQLSGSGVIAGGKLACASFATAAASATVGGLEFAVGGRFAANGATCPWTDGPSDGTAFDLTLNEGTLAVGEATLTLSGAGSIRGGRLACAELDAAGAAPIDVAGITFAVGARYAATGETCVWKDGAETIGTQNTVMLALKDGTLTVGEQSFTLSGAATLENGRLACATLDAIGVGKLGLGGVLFDAGAQYAAAGHACPWTDGPVPEHTLELTLRDGQVAAGDATLMLSGAAEIAGGKLTCADFKGDGAFPVAGLSFATRARYAASGETCGFSDATADRLELLLDDATVRVGDATVVLSGRGLIETGKLRCATFDASGNVPLGGLSATVGGRLATAGATCEWTYGPAAQNRFELTLGGATVNLDGVGAVTLSGYGRVDGGALTCAELGATGELAVGGVEFDLGARFTRAGQTCTWADGTQSSATAHTFTFALLNGSLAVGPTTLALSGAATLSGGKLVCAELDAAGATTIDLAGVRFDAGARYSAAGHPCAWRDGTVTTSTDSTLELALRDGQLAVGPASVTLSGLGQIQNNTLTCAEFDVAGDLSIAGIGFDAGARYAAAGQSCGWSDGAANTLALTLREGALDVGGVQVVLTGSATVAGGALTCASLDTTGAVGLAGLTFDLGARYARAGATCGTGSKAAQDTFEVTLNDGTLTFGSATLSLDGTARVEAARLTCAELGADGGASADLGGITFDADVRYARGGASCSWSDGTTTALEKSALLLGLQNGELRVGDTKLTLRGTGSIVGSQVACAELDAAGGANVALGGVAFDAGARYAGTGHACTWSDGSVRPAGPQALDLHLANGTVTVGENTLTLSGSASLEAGQLTCAELTSTGAVPLGGIMFAAGARYAAAGSECGWSDGQSARFELSLEEGTLRVGNVDVTLAGRGTLAGKALACAELSSSSTVKTSVGGVAFNLGARFIGAGQTCPNGGAPTSDHRFDVTLTDGTLAVDGAALTLAGTAESQGGTLTCATLSSTGQLDLAGVSFTAGARYAASGATCAWATAPAKANQLDLTLDQGQLTVGPTTLTLSGAATLVGSKLTCAELTAGGGATLSLGAVAFEAGARYAAKGETCVYTDGSVALPQASASLRLALAKGEIRAADASVLLAGWGRIDGGELTCAELRSSGDVALAGVSFETGARFTRAGATCTWGDGTTSSAATTTFGLTLDDGRLQVGATELRLSGEGTLVGTELACASLNATGATQIDLAGISFEAGARFTAEGQTCPWTEGDVPNAHVLELTLKNGSLVVGATTVSLSGAARLDGGALSCAELAADGNTTIDLAGATFSVGARYAAADATCTWPDGTVTAPAKDTLAVRLAGQLDVAGQTMAVSGTGTLEGNTVTCAELGATAGFTSVDLGGVSFGTGARYAAAGRTCTWADGSETVASADTYKLELALRDGVVTVAGNTLTLSGTATLEAGQVTSAQLAVTGDVTIAGVTFAASASYDGPSGKLILRLDEGKLEAGFTTIDLEGQGEIDTVSRSVNCVAFSAKGNAAADLAGVTFQVGARYAAKGASCPDMTVPTDGARFEATLEDGTLSLGDGATVTVSGTGTIEGGRILCATFEATGAVSGGSAGVSFDGRARYAAQGQSCGWREAVDAAAIAIDLSSTITIGPNVLTLVGTGTIGAGGVECAALEVTGDVVLAGVTFDVGARAVAAGATCAWPDGTVSLPGVARVEVVLRDGTLSLGDVNARLSGIATAEKTPGGYVVPCLGLDAHADGAWPFGGVAFTGRAEFTAAGRQCGWDAAPVSGHTFSLALEDGALRVGSVNTTLSGSALIASGAARCIEFAAATAVTGFAGITFDLGARYAAAGASCTWQDGTTATYPARTFAARLVDGNVTVGAQSVSLSGSATVAGGTLECAALEAAGDVSVELASTTFSVDGRYAAAGAACEWLAAPYDVNTFTLALEGDLDVDGNTLALTGDATLAGGAITCAAFTSSGDVPLGGLAFDAGARYASAGASCGWNTPEPAARLQVGLSGASVQLGPVALALSGYADLAGNRLECVEFAGSGDLREAFGGVAMTGGARYAATGTTCTWKDGSATTGQAFALDLGGNAKIGSTSVALRGTAAIENGAVRCLTLDAAGADANLAGLDVSVSGLWAAPLATCGDVTAGNSAALQARVAGEFTVGTNTASVSGWGRIEGGSLQCVDLAADGAVSIPLGELNVDLAARFAKAGATCAWEDGTSSTPAKDTLYARLTGDLAVGDDTLALSGNGLVSGGKIACAELASTGKLALAGVTFDAGARYAAGTELCQWEDGSFTPASGAASLRVALDRGVVSVGGNTVELSGLAELNSAVGITCASFDVSGDVAIAGITFAGSGRYAAAGQSCGAWDQSDLSALELAVTGGAVDLGGQQVAVSGALSVTDGRVTSGTVAATGAISLAGLTVAPKPGKPSISLAYSATYDAGQLQSQSLVATLDGTVTIAGLGTFSVSGSGAIVDGGLDAITLSLGAQLTLGGVQLTAQSIDLVYKRHDPNAGGAATLALVIDEGQVAITGLGTLDVSGNSYFTAGKLTRFSLAIATDLTLAGVTVKGGASLLWLAANNTLTFTLDQATASIVDLGTLTLSGQSTLVAGVLDSLELAASGAIALAGTSVTGSASLAYQRVNPITLAPSLTLRLESASLVVAPFGKLNVSGEAVIDNGALTSFDLALDTAVQLGGIPLSGGLSLSYRSVGRELRFSVEDASATIAGVGTLTVNGSALITNGTLGALSLSADGSLTLAGVAIAGEIELVYAGGAASSLTLRVNDATVAITGLDTAVSVSGVTQLTGGRLTTLSLTVSGNTSFQGIALTGALSLEYTATYSAAGAITSRSLRLALSGASLVVPGATVTLGGRLEIDGGAIACADLGPATVAFSGVDFSVTAYYVAAGKTCGRLAQPAPAAVFAGEFEAAMEIAGTGVVVEGAAAIVGGRIDSVKLATSLSLTTVPGLNQVDLSGSYAGGEVCLAGAIDGTLTLPFGAQLLGMRASFCAQGFKVSALDVKVDVIAPNLVGEPLHLLATAGYDGESTKLSATLCLAGETATGETCCAGTSDACPATTWKPFSGGLIPGLPGEWANLAVTTLSGGLSIGGGSVGIDAIGIVDGSGLPVLVPGLSLKSIAVSLSASVGSNTAASAGIRGIFTVPLGEQPVEVSVAGLFELGGGAGVALTLSGGIGDKVSGVSADVEPLKAFIGENTLEISYLTVEVKASTSGVSFKLGGGANVTLPAPVNVGPLGMQLEGYGSLGKKTGFYLVGAICGLTLPAGILPQGFTDLLLGQPSPCVKPAVAVALASRAFPEVEIAPNTTVKRGLTLAATIAPPRGVLKPLGLESIIGNDPGAPSEPTVPFGPLPGGLGRLLPSLPSIVAEIGVDTSGLRLKGALNFPWQVIRPDWNLPAVKLLQLNELAFEVLLNSSPTLEFTGSVLFEPSHCIPDYESFVKAGLASDQSPFVAFDPAKIECLDLPAPFLDRPQQQPLKGTARLRYKPETEFGGEISLQGVWYEPFWVPNLAVASPGITLNIRLINTPYGPIPAPTSLGINGDVFWKRPYYDDAGATPTYPVTCATDADCTGFGNCAGGKCPASCIDGPDGDALPDTCQYDWPYNCHKPDPNDPDAACIDALQRPAPVPASLANSGVTLFYDVYPSPSALLVPLPTVIVRRELNNLSTLDLAPAMNELKDGSRNLFRWMETRLPGISPELSPFPPCIDLDGDGTLDKSFSCILPAEPLPNLLSDLPIAVDIDKVGIYFATHERELFGITFSPGIRADLDTKLAVVPAPTCDAATPCTGGLTCDDGTCKRVVAFSGALGAEGLSLSGRASPVSLLDTITLKGDPFTKFADLRGGAVEVAATPALEALPGTVEAWVLPDAPAAGEWQTVARQVGSSGGGYELQVGAPSLHCDAAYDRCDGGGCALWRCENGPGASLPGEMPVPAPCADDGTAGLCSVCPDGTEPCDLPCATNAECVTATGVSTATCRGHVLPTTDGAILSALKASKSVDLTELMEAAGRACPATGDLAACVAAGLQTATGASVGTALSPTCAGCFADFVTCEERANVRVNVLRGGAVTRTVRAVSPPASLDRWTHVAARFDADTGDIVLFADGALVPVSDDGGQPDCDTTCSCDAVCAASPTSSACGACTRKRDPDELLIENAISDVAADCTSCKAALATWKADAAGNGRWPVPGAGATLRLGDGLGGLDDVRVWTSRRTADQIDGFKNGLRQDASPEKLGDCSNAKRGKCSDQSGSCESDFDCDAGTCVGFIPSGTCRSDVDCTAGATCGGYVPPEQRYAFDTGLLARWEFDYDSYKSALGRAWNTRYHGDPA